MIEPPNHTAFHDNAAYTWVRVDEHPGPYGTWYALTDDPDWDECAGTLNVGWGHVQQRVLSEVGADEAARYVRRVKALLS